MKNRVIALILTLVVVFGFAGCGGKKMKDFVQDKILNTAETEAPAVQTEKPAKAEETPAPTAQAAAGVRAEFKAALDGYEAFFNEYAEFMKSYNSASASTGQLTQYLAMLSRYSEAMTALDELSEEDMNDAELIYYMEVMSRISAKLLEAAG